MTESRPAAMPDLRPAYRGALSWAADLIAGVRPDQLEAPTPCTDFDVRTLLGHLLTTAERARVAGTGGDVTVIPRVVVVPDDRYADAYADAVAGIARAWDDEAALTRMVTVPWGTVPGAGVIAGYLNETLVHGWDLAVATGQPSEADPALVEAVAGITRAFIPAEQRGGAVPFGPVVEPRPEAGPTERLANWSGRPSPEAWRAA